MNIKTTKEELSAASDKNMEGVGFDTTYKRVKLSFCSSPYSIIYVSGKITDRFINDYFNNKLLQTGPELRFDQVRKVEVRA